MRKQDAKKKITKVQVRGTEREATYKVAEGNRILLPV